MDAHSGTQPRDGQTGVALRARDARQPFSPEQLTLIFSGAPYAAGAPRAAKFYVPLVALFTGARLNEICQLATDDVETRDGVPVVLIRAGGGRSVKSAAARRVLPIHPELVKMGFLAFADAQRLAGHDRLFHELGRDARGHYADAFSKWFARSLRAAGASRPRTSFHSFRHNFRDALREADVGREATLALGGWAGSGVADQVYGGGLRPATLAREVAKIRYPGLDLAHLHRPATI